MFRFVNGSDYVPTKHSVLCELDFENIYKNKEKYTSLNWLMTPVPTIHSAEPIDTLPFLRPLKYLDSLLEREFSRRIYETLFVYMTRLTH